MKTKPFDIKYRPQIESGEYKVVTREDRPVEIIKWDLKGDFPVIGVYFDEKNDRDTAVQVTAYGRCSIKPGDYYCDDFFIINSMQEEPLIEDLEEEWNRYITSEEYLKDIPGGLPVARHFAKWQKQQLMKGAIEGYVDQVEYPDLTLIQLSENPKDLKDGDKVKIIIIKKD